MLFSVLLLLWYRFLLSLCRALECVDVLALLHVAWFSGLIFLINRVIFFLYQ
jgi:hypothetical protein